MQRLGRKGHPTYRVVVQDSRQTPTSGKVVAMLGSYDPHTKTSTLVKEKAQFYVDHGAQPSDRVVKLFSSEGVKLPKWVKEPTKQTREIRNSDKLRRNRPPEEKTEEPAAESAAPEAEDATTEPASESKVEAAADEPSQPEEAPKENEPAEPDEFPEDAAAEEKPAKEAPAAADEKEDSENPKESEKKA